METFILGFLTVIIVTIITSIIIKRYRRNQLYWQFSKTLKRTGHPLIELYHNKTPYLFLIDTGATHNLIDKNIIDKLDKKFIKKNAKIVEGIGIVNNDEIFDTYRIRFDDQYNSFTDDFISYDMSDMFVDEEQSLDKPVIGILGVGFLSKYALTLDFKSNTVR